MTLSNSEKILDSMFYEADTIYIGQKHLINPGMATNRSSFYDFINNEEKNYPRYIKLAVIPVDNKKIINLFFHMKAKVSSERILNTDGKTTFSDLSKEITLKSEKINYNEDNHRLKWLNIISGNIKNNITGIYHGVIKGALPLFLHEQEWRFNHINTGKSIMEKVSKYITKSFPINMEKLSQILYLSKSYFSPCV